MSRIGKKPVPVPAGLTVKIENGSIRMKGPKGELVDGINPLVQVAYQEKERLIVVTRKDESRAARAIQGLQRALIRNMVIGVADGYSRAMEVHGTGYTVDVKGSDLVFVVGFATPGVIPIPAGIKIEVQQRAAQPTNPAKFTVSACDKQKMGEFTAAVRHIRPPEPYQGKGIRYADEQVRRKEGKAVAGTGAA